MSTKKSVNLAIPEDLLEEFSQVCKKYGHAKQKGMVLSAAMLMFLKADPQEQGRCLEEVAVADIARGVKAMIERAKAEQYLRVSTREALAPGSAPSASSAPGSTLAPGSAPSASSADKGEAGVGGDADDQAAAAGRGKLKKAAKKAGKSKRGRTGLPKPGKR
jgi:antitoxin component of RelBE/YafQ-DinJ toxin-antitoxin module